MAAFDKVKSGFPGVDNILDFIRMGDNVVWQVNDIDDMIDFVFTHDAPASDKLYLGYDGVDELNRYFETLRDEMSYGKWFYGHLHDNRHVMDNHYLLYEQIIRIA